MLRFFQHPWDSIKSLCNEFFHPNHFPEFIISDTILALKNTANNALNNRKRIKAGELPLHVGHVLSASSCTLLMAGADALHKLKLKETPEKKHTYTVYVLGTLALMLAREDAALKNKDDHRLYPITYDQLQKDYDHVPMAKKLDITAPRCPTRKFFIQNIGEAINSDKLPRPKLDKDMFPLLTSILSSHLSAKEPTLTEQVTGMKKKFGRS